MYDSNTDMKVRVINLLPNISSSDCHIFLFQAASGALILARTRERNKSERGLVSDEVVSTLQIQDVEAEQRKYNNFWVGIQRRIELKKLNVRTDSTHVNKEKKNIVSANLFSFNDLEYFYLNILTCTLNNLDKSQTYHSSIEQQQGVVGPSRMFPGDLQRHCYSPKNWL